MKEIPMCEAVARLIEGITVTASGCWEWTGAKNSQGYGVMGGSLVHRTMYTMLYGRIPAGKFACHTCDNPSCANPEHIFIGTAQDNTDDMMQKRRYPKRILPSGEKHHQSKLTWEDVRDIRRRCDGPVKARPRQRDLAAEFKVSQATICAVVKRRIWRE
jgi:hypothetical protein